MNATSSSARARLQVELLEQRSLPSSSSYVSALYTDLLNRPGSAPEVAAWVAQLDLGMPATQVTNAFVTGPEFRSDEIQNDYQIFLQRAPQPAEVQGWLQGLDNGLSEQQLKVAFLSSPEFFELHGNDNGSWVAAVYQTVLGRAPDAAGLAGWTGQLQKGVSLQTVAQQIVMSPEGVARQVNTAYEQFLGRAPDAPGLASWSDQLEHGLSPAQFDALLTSSPEYIALKGGLDVIPVVPGDPPAPTGEVFPSTGVVDPCPTTNTDPGTTVDTGSDPGTTDDTGYDPGNTGDTGYDPGNTGDSGDNSGDTGYDPGSDF